MGLPPPGLALLSGGEPWALFSDPDFLSSPLAEPCGLSFIGSPDLPASLEPPSLPFSDLSPLLSLKAPCSPLLDGSPLSLALALGLPSWPLSPGLLDDLGSLSPDLAFLSWPGLVSPLGPLDS